MQIADPKHRDALVALVADVVREVLKRLEQPAGNARSPAPSQGAAPSASGVFRDVDAAVAAATRAQLELSNTTVENRGRAVECIRKVMRRDKDELGRIEFDETKLGKLDHKIEKLEVAAGVPGTEMLRTDATSGDHGLTVTEYAPYGVIGVVTPVTHSIPTLGCNAIMMIAAGNSLVCNPHPSAVKCAVEATRRWNGEIRKAIGIDNLICIIENPTIESAQAIFRHPDVRMLCVTGGPTVANAALSSGKRAVAAGPGNPPVVVDETADISKAGKAIVAGAAYDNGVLCISEKEVFVVRAVADKLLAALEQGGGHRLSPDEMDRIAAKTLSKDETTGHYVPRTEFVGQEPQVLADAIGVKLRPDTKLLFGKTEESNPLVPCEQMMPLLPVVVVENPDPHGQGLRLHRLCEERALRRGFGHRRARVCVVLDRLADG